MLVWLIYVIKQGPFFTRIGDFKVFYSWCLRDNAFVCALWLIKSLPVHSKMRTIRLSLDCVHAAWVTHSPSLYKHNAPLLLLTWQMFISTDFMFVKPHDVPPLLCFYVQTEMRFGVEQLLTITMTITITIMTMITTTITIAIIIKIMIK